MKIDNEPNTPKKNGPRKYGEKLVEGVIVGREKLIIDPQEVFKLASIGMKDTEISDWLGLNDNTLRFNFSVELLKGRESLKISLRRAMLNNAIQNNNTVMQIFLAKNFLGMSDSPLDAEANAPLPWNEDDTVAIEDNDPDTLEVVRLDELDEDELQDLL